MNYSTQKRYRNPSRNAAIGSGSGGGSAQYAPIPPLHVRIVSETGEDNKIMAWWVSDNEDFLNSNPQVWLFRKRTRRKTTSSTKRRVSGLIHPTDSTRTPSGSAFLDGQQYVKPSASKNNTSSKIGHHTEWPLAAYTNGKLFEVPVVVSEWLSVHIDLGALGNAGGDTLWFPYNVNNITSYQNPNVLLDFRASGVKNSRINSQSPRTQRFRFAITIDNPAYSPTNHVYPKIIGPMSNEVLLYFQNIRLNGSIDYNYRLNEIIPSFDRIRDISNT